MKSRKPALAAHLPKNALETFDLGANVEPMHKMLIRRGGGIFGPSDLYQVQGHWRGVIWLMEAFLLQSCVCTGNDRPVCLTSFAGWSLPSFSSVQSSWFLWNVCLGSSPQCGLRLEFRAEPKMETSCEMHSLRDSKQRTQTESFCHASVNP